MKNLEYKSHFLDNNKGLSCVASLIALASVCTYTPVANAATFSFSFSNETGSVPGTVEGMIELPDGDGIFAATSVIVTSAPSQVLPPNGTDFVPNAQFNFFEVVDGEIVNSSVELTFLSTTNGLTLDFFGLDFAALINEATSDNVQSDITSVNFTSVTSTPESTSVITLLGLSVLGIGSKLKEKK